MKFDPAMVAPFARAGVAEAEIARASSVGGGETGVPRFAESMWQAVQGVDDKNRDAGDRMAAVDSGRSDDLVGAMLASQEASLSFSMLMQVRNKVVGAVDELIKLQL
ncbi:MAG: flagellar hook-basal body complex protein FliE [Aromatoleum sp.]|jgi:flagellar hook-basal body complex protein FliE|uniref:flagellar hook-basal body complex protein FliE n=1 Tax=Aromatoleum sp. TaxID=2307007 RepID=UPI0028943770|nr:flagellar hook-basal body complex protein FliE [Aromatoleum sp.]MDT3671889.1 flagellar hook-basal body complex protein FliE [Aromatoleum sp.]